MVFRLEVGNIYVLLVFTYWCPSPNRRISREGDSIYRTTSNRIYIINLLEDNSSIKLYRLLPLNFKKFIKLKKGLTNKELHKLLPKRYYNFINIYL